MAREENNNKQEKQRLELKPYSLSDLARIYQMHRETFRNWIMPFQDEIGVRRGRFYTIKQVKIIIDKLGLPGYLKLEDE